MKMFFNLVEKLFKNPTGANLMALNKIMTLGIPFNAPHGFKIKEISDEAVRITVPNRKLNHNHLAGIHACAIATVGEYCAGTALLQCFGSSKYRLILSELNVKYTYQGRMDLIGSCSPKQVDKEAVKTALESEGKYLQTLQTFVKDISGNEVAVVTTTWQLKSWDKVKTK